MITYWYITKHHKLSWLKTATLLLLLPILWVDWGSAEQFCRGSHLRPLAWLQSDDDWGWNIHDSFTHMSGALKGATKRPGSAGTLGVLLSPHRPRISPSSSAYSNKVAEALTRQLRAPQIIKAAMRATLCHILLVKVSHRASLNQCSRGLHKRHESWRPGPSLETSYHKRLF